MSIMQLVKKKKGKKRPGYRGDDAAKADRAARSEGRASMGRADERGGVDRGGGDGGNKFTEFTKQNLNPQVDTITQKFTGRSPFFGGANKFGYTNVRPDGSLQPGFGGRIFGGLLSLLTGIPFIGGAIGSMYDKGTGIFDRTKGFFRRGPNYNDMSQFNRLGLFGLPPGTLDEDDKIAQALTEAQLKGYSRFGDLGLPNQTNTADLNQAFNVGTNNVPSGRFDVNQDVNTNIGMGASRNMIGPNEIADYYNSQQFMDGGIVDLVDIYD